MLRIALPRGARLSDVVAAAADVEHALQRGAVVHDVQLQGRDAVVTLASTEAAQAAKAQPWLVCERRCDTQLYRSTPPHASRHARTGAVKKQVTKANRKWNDMSRKAKNAVLRSTRKKLANGLTPAMHTHFSQMRADMLKCDRRASQ